MNTRSRLLNRATLIPIALLMLMPERVVFGQMANATVKTGKPPAWVQWLTVDSRTAAKIEQDTGGQVLTLIDTQVNVESAETFIHVVKEITSETGVRSAANLEFTWDPSFQELIVHQITLRRGTEGLDRLEPASFKIVQQETDLSRQLYNGALSALLFLQDVRVGDSIEYAFTIRGQNPSLKAHYADSFTMGLPVAAQRRRLRVLWPGRRTLGVRSHGITAEPEVRNQGGLKEYLWDLRNVPPVVIEDQAPTWLQVYPWIQISEFRNWAEVATWAMAFYSASNREARELKEQIAKLRHPNAPAGETVQRALEFAQNDVRYLGIEFGPNSYHPSDPVTVLQRRFGDCKDKAFLLCTLLQGLGYEATPVLVATGFRHTLKDLLPSPHDFDHVIVRAVAEGKTYWLDPTRSYQHGPIAQRSLPEYSFGLVVRPGETDLTPIPTSVNGTADTSTREVFRVGSQTAPTQLSVVRTFRGVDAEWMRAILSAQGAERLAKSYLNDYAQRYPGVTPVGSMEVEDAPNSDTVILRDHYTITNFWVLSENKQVYNCQFYPLGIHTWITKPATAIRSMPMELSFPRRRAVQTEIELPREFILSNLTNTIASPAAELGIKRFHRGRKVWLDYEYRALTNFVPASVTARHLNSLDQMENALGYSLNWQNEAGIAASSQFNWPIFLLGVIYAAALSAAALLFCRHQFQRVPRATSAAPPPLNQQPNSLGGWLILVGFGLVAGPVRLLINMNHSMGSFSLWKWHALTTPGGVSYHPAWAPLLTLELLGHITLLILELFSVALFFQKRRIFPGWFIALIVFNAIFIIGDTIGMQMLKTSLPSISSDPTRSLMQALIACCIWIPYMSTSQRVRATFVQ